MNDDAHRDDELDRRLRDIARSARDHAEAVGGDEVDRALAEVLRGRRATSVRAAGEHSSARRTVLWLGVAATVIGMFVGFVTIRWADRDGTSSVPPVAPDSDGAAAITVPSSSTVPTEGVAPESSTADSSTSTSTPSTTTSTTATSTSTTTSTSTSVVPSTTVPSGRATSDEVAALLADVAWEGTGIGRACDDVETSETTGAVCTRVLISPEGVPISLDPQSGVVTVHVREAGTYRMITVPDELQDDDVVPLAVGPDDIAYFVTPPDGEASDVHAMSIAAEDAGRVLERYPRAIPIGDIDVLASPAGLVSSGWYAQGPRPAADAELLVEWFDREASGPASAVEWTWFDDAADTVGVDDREWAIDGRLVDPEQPGTSQVVATFDGGFVATYLETTGDHRAEVIRGWPDGAVEHWLLPGAWTDLGSPVIEPMGTFLLPAADTFFRVAPFDDRMPDLGGLEIDYETGVVDVAQVNAHLEGLASDDPLRSADPEALANAIAGRVTSPAEVRTIVSRPASDSGTNVVVTTERFLDDSVYGTRLAMVLDAGSVRSITWSQTCQRDRGQQDYQAALCV